MKIVFVVAVILTGVWFWTSNQTPGTDDVELVEYEEEDLQVTPSHTTSEQSKESSTMASQDEVSIQEDEKKMPEVTEDVVSELELSQEEMKAITQEVLSDFDAIDVPSELPEDKGERYTLLSNLYLKSSYYLNEVVSGNLPIRREELSKAFSITLLYAKENNASDISDVLNMLEKDNPQVFQESLKELSQEEADKIRETQELVTQEEIDY